MWYAIVSFIMGNSPATRRKKVGSGFSTSVDNRYQNENLDRFRNHIKNAAIGTEMRDDNDSVCFFMILRCIFILI